MVPTPERPGNGMILAYRNELAAYLGRSRGATELTPKLLPRPTGEATQVVITEHANGTFSQTFIWEGWTVHLVEEVYATSGTATVYPTPEVTA